MNINTFLGLCADAVRHTELKSKKREMLQTFAVLRSASDASTENLTKNKLYTNKAYFYSRKWEALKKHPSKFSYDYPACFTYVLSTNTFNPFNFQKHCHNIRFEAVYPNVDRLGQESTLSKYCEAIPVEEIYVLMEEHLRRIFDYLLGVVYADVDGTYMWKHEDYLSQAVTDAVITSYTVDESTTRKYIAMLKRENEQANGGYIDDFGADMLCGVSKVLTFCDTECSTFTYNFDTTNCCVDYDS